MTVFFFNSNEISSNSKRSLKIGKNVCKIEKKSPLKRKESSLLRKQ